MSYALRDRPDGQVEIIRLEPVLVAVVPEKGTADILLKLLMDYTALTGVAPSLLRVPSPSLAEKLPPPLTPRKTAAVVPPVAQGMLPAVIAQPRSAPVLVKPKYELTEAIKDAAFARMERGETTADVARDMDIPFNVLRGSWAYHVRIRQKRLAEAGPQPCTMCTELFVPSISSPEKCARCSRD